MTAPPRRFNPWPWVPAAVLAVAVVADAVLIRLAVTTRDERVDRVEAVLRDAPADRPGPADAELPP